MIVHVIYDTSYPDSISASSHLGFSWSNYSINSLTPSVEMHLINIATAICWLPNKIKESHDSALISNNVLNIYLKNECENYRCWNWHQQYLGGNLHCQMLSSFTSFQLKCLHIFRDHLFINVFQVAKWYLINTSLAELESTNMYISS